MSRGFLLGTAVAGTALLLASAAQAQFANNLVAAWVEYAPGSSADRIATNIAIANGTDTTDAYSWGNAPTSLVNTILVRAVLTSAASCPTATLDDGSAVVMKQRFIGANLTSTPGSPSATGATNSKSGYPSYFVASSATAPANFGDGTPKATTSWGECEAVVPNAATHKTVTVAGTTLKLPVAKPKRILVMADTGCRINGTPKTNGANQQNCHSPAAFPLKYLSQYEATFKPDVILQVGDWFYRDTACTNGASVTWCTSDTTSAAYETWGDTFDSWNADVLFPMQTLLATAPWIMVRGNHESCGRGARGWYALLDAFPYSYNNVVCSFTTTYPSPSGSSATYTGDFEPTYVVPLNGVNFLVHDSSFANDSAVDPTTSQNYDIDLSNVINTLATTSPNTPAVFATHKPVFGLSFGSAPAGCAVALGTPPTDNSGDFTEQGVFNGGTGYASSAFKTGVPSNIALFLSGHVHQFQYFNFNSVNGNNAEFPPQLIVGTGGSLLDPDCGSTATTAYTSGSTFGNVPSGVQDVKKFTQTGASNSGANFTVNTNGTGLVAQTANTFSHDEFAFALFDPLTSGGNLIGYTAEIYKISSARAGICKITFNPRKISCSL